MLRVVWVVTAMSGLGACLGDGGPPANSTLADLDSLSMTVEIWQAQDDAPTAAFIHVGYDVDAFRAAHGGACAVVGDFEVAVPGARVVDTSRGDTDDEYDDCYMPSAGLEIRDFGDTALTTASLRDDSLAIEATFAPDVLAPHQPTLRSSSSWKFAGAEEVVLGWSHPNDLVDGADFLDSPVYFHTGTLDDPNYFDVVATFSGDEIRFHIPDPPAILGDGYIVTRFGYEGGEAETCTGASRCLYSVERGYAHSVQITRRNP